MFSDHVVVGSSPHVADRERLIKHFTSWWDCLVLKLLPITITTVTTLSTQKARGLWGEHSDSAASIFFIAVRGLEDRGLLCFVCTHDNGRLGNTHKAPCLILEVTLRCNKTFNVDLFPLVYIGLRLVLLTPELDRVTWPFL